MIYARSFSKTLSGSLRVGFLAARQAIADDLADVKMLTSITSSQFVERLLYMMLVDGHYRKYLTRLHKSLDEARLSVTHAFERIGIQLFAEPDAGMFVWARFPHIDDALTLTESAGKNGIMLAPGVVEAFRMVSEGLEKATGTERLDGMWGYEPKPPPDRRGRIAGLQSNGP